MLGPVLQGDRVRFEPPRPENLETVVRWFADPEVTRELGFEEVLASVYRCNRASARLLVAKPATASAVPSATGRRRRPVA